MNSFETSIEFVLGADEALAGARMGTVVYIYLEKRRKQRSSFQVEGKTVGILINVGIIIEIKEHQFLRHRWLQPWEIRVIRQKV